MKKSHEVLLWPGLKMQGCLVCGLSLPCWFTPPMGGEPEVADCGVSAISSWNESREGPGEREKLEPCSPGEGAA